MTENSKQLVLIVTASNTGAIGYAEMFACEVQEKRVGDLKEDRLNLTILDGDSNNLNFLSSHPHPQQIEIGFNRLRTNEPYRTAPISGFVDENDTSWEISYMREAHKAD